jgi:hypothetical protein
MVLLTKTPIMIEMSNLYVVYRLEVVEQAVNLVISL